MPDPDERRRGTSPSDGPPTRVVRHGEPRLDPVLPAPPSPEPRKYPHPYFEDEVLVFPPGYLEPPAWMLDMMFRPWAEPASHSGPAQGETGAATKTREVWERHTEKQGLTLDAKANARKAAKTLLRPPVGFSDCSQKLAAELQQIADDWSAVSKSLFIGYLGLLATTDPVEHVPGMVANKDPDVAIENMAQAMLAIPVIQKSRMRQAITLALVGSNSCIPQHERAWWESVNKGLGA